MRYYWGKLEFDPDKQGRNILIGKVDGDFVSYYIHLFHTSTYWCIPINRRRLGGHFTIILDEQINDRGKRFLEIIDGGLIKFWYDPNKWKVNKYLLLNIECGGAGVIRRFCGLPFHVTKYSLHLSIGDFKNNEYKERRKQEGK